MENYNDKVNRGTEESPLMRDRLFINSNKYGFNLIDRKIQKSLLANKSKETCEKGKEFLLGGELEVFQAFKESVKDEEIVTNKILVCKEKHSDEIYSVPTLKDLHKVALHILQYRFENGYFQKWNLPQPLDYNLEDIEKLPESFRQDARRKLLSNLEEIRSAKNNNREYDNAKKALETEDGEEAFSILSNRNDYEYEGFELIEPIKIK